MEDEKTYQLELMCLVPDCSRKHCRSGLCVTHYTAQNAQRCSVDVCSNGHFAKSFCSLHYQRLRRYGDPLHQGQKRTYGSEEDRFWAKVNQNGRTVKPELGPCWEWTASTDKYGYAQFKTDRGMVKAHRFVFTLLSKTLDPTLTIDHVCEVKHCVNPKHLDEVTRRINVLRFLLGRGYGDD